MLSDFLLGKRSFSDLWLRNTLFFPLLEQSQGCAEWHYLIVSKNCPFSTYLSFSFVFQLYWNTIDKNQICLRYTIWLFSLILLKYIKHVYVLSFFFLFALSFFLAMVFIKLSTCRVLWNIMMINLDKILACKCQEKETINSKQIHK